jgi:hypothetical protein
VPEVSPMRRRNAGVLSFQHSRVSSLLLDGPHVLRLGTLSPVRDVELNLLTFIERSVPVATDARVVNENVLLAI